jgi:UDP-3-O-[3-hydroxymyristoyl] glucosamine N-acyltransferase
MSTDSLLPAASQFTITLSALADRLGATLHGDGGGLISGVAGIEEAGAGDLTFVANPKYAAIAKRTAATAVLVEPDFPEIAAATLRVANPYLAFARAIEVFYSAPVYAPGIHPTAVVAESAKIGANAHIGAYAVIGEHVVLGDDAVVLSHVVLYPHVRVGDRFFAHAHAVVREHCRLGDDVTLQNGAIVGADGFGFARQHGKEFAGRAWYKIRQSGPAVLEDAVEVQANACVDRASIGETRVGSGSKIDNLVQVGHGSTVGKDTLLCAQVGLAGSTTVGNNVILAGQVGVAGHCTVGDGAIATAQSGIPGDVAAGTTVSGYPAIENRQWLRSVAVFNRLPEIVRQLKAKNEA